MITSFWKFEFYLNASLHFRDRCRHLYFQHKWKGKSHTSRFPLLLSSSSSIPWVQTWRNKIPYFNSIILSSIEIYIKIYKLTTLRLIRLLELNRSSLSQYTPVIIDQFSSCSKCNTLEIRHQFESRTLLWVKFCFWIGMSFALNTIIAS